MKINICGFTGFGNVGDEAILQSIMDELDEMGNNEYFISTSLPYSRIAWNNYYNVLMKTGNNVIEIRTCEDMRTDFDVYILGGGDLNWGYGWRQCLSIFANGIKCMNYGVAYNKRWYYSAKLHKMYLEFLKNFNVITVRDEYSYDLLKNIGMNNVILTFDPAINLREEKFDCPIGKIVVFPRYDDIISNQSQMDWFVDELKDVSNDVILVPCAPRNLDSIDIDLELCKYLHGRLTGSRILEISPFEPKKFKYFVSQSRLLYSGGRYHPIIFAMAHNIPFKISPIADDSKIKYLLDMYQKYGGDGLKKLAEKNKRIFVEMK